MESKFLTSLANGCVQGVLRPIKDDGLDDGPYAEQQCFLSFVDEQECRAKRLSPTEVLFTYGETANEMRVTLNKKDHKKCTYVLSGSFEREAEIEFCNCLAAIVDCGEVVVVAPRRFLEVPRKFRSHLMQEIYNNPELSVAEMNPPEGLLYDEISLLYKFYGNTITLEKRSQGQVNVHMEDGSTILLLSRKDTSGDYMAYPSNGEPFAADVESCGNLCAFIRHSTDEVFLVLPACQLDLFE